jgi:hypothetical protein
MRRLARLLVALLSMAALAPIVGGAASCGPGDFDPQSKVAGVRILASKADKPYAKPGDAVHLEVLSYDGRADTSRPMKMYWIPLVCENPTNDAYYGCFAPPAADAGPRDAAGDGGLSLGAGLGLLRPGVDLTPFLKTGPSLDITVPTDAVTSHVIVQGLDAPYGIAIVFNVACAGHLELIDIDPATGQQQVPIACFDDDENQLDPSQYVIGFTRVYAYDTRTNANPVIDHVTYQGSPVDLAKGIDVDRCTTALRGDCPEVTFDITVTDASWEANPGDKDPDGNIRHEQVWAAYFSNVGQLEGDARLLYDPVRGKVDGSEVNYQAPNEAGDGIVWIVVHDNRGGASWVQVPLHVH